MTLLHILNLIFLGASKSSSTEISTSFAFLAEIAHSMNQWQILYTSIKTSHYTTFTATIFILCVGIKILKLREQIQQIQSKSVPPPLS